MIHSNLERDNGYAEFYATFIIDNNSVTWFTGNETLSHAVILYASWLIRLVCVKNNTLASCCRPSIRRKVSSGRSIGSQQVSTHKFA